ncbi:protein GAMETE EXPRESSED 3 [Senna tora]|uniref:Protein GAMETE EXPRESSED 3 n=1 Tax=Senna tora TaxID=362788 RepID=A0A834WK72_9FABA|nr:protein GAMETE EXPRESSED 3 [Senna tora]
MYQQYVTLQWRSFNHLSFWYLSVNSLLLFLLIIPHPEVISGPSLRLSKPLIGDDGRIYACSDNYFFAFENNGTIAWSSHLDFKCNVAMAPLHGGPGKIYVVAENRVVRINFGDAGISEASAQVFFGAEEGHQSEVEIIGFSVSTMSSNVFINIKNRGLFAYHSQGNLRWSVGPVLYQSGYAQGCRKNLTHCYFTSVPVLDQCEASLYISNTEGELYCLSIRSRYFRWIQDFSSLDKTFTITPGNNGHLYVTIPLKALVLALDVFSGNVLWQRSVGPLSKADSAVVVDSNGWVSIGSLDGFLYSFSPTGSLKKFSRRNVENFVIQVGPLLDCSGYAVYVSQTEMEGKISHTIDDDVDDVEYTYVSAIRPKSTLFTTLVPATGSIYWSETYPGEFSSLLANSDLSQFVIDEEILLAFLAASKTGNPLQCRTVGEKLTSSCSQARTKLVNIYTGNERAIVLFLFLESALLAVLAGVVRFCCTFWSKKKIQHQGLGSFLDKRRSLQQRKKTFDRIITELEQRGTQDEAGNEINKKIDDMVRERDCIERKLSTTYSLGRDKTDFRSKSLLPLYKGAKESVAIFHTLSDTSSRESSSSTEEDTCSMVESMNSSDKAKEKAPMEWDSSSEEDFIGREYTSVSSEIKGSSKLLISSSPGEEERSKVKSVEEEGEREIVQKNPSSTCFIQARWLLHFFFVLFFPSSPFDGGNLLAPPHMLGFGNKCGGCHCFVGPEPLVGPHHRRSGGGRCGILVDIRIRHVGHTSCRMARASCIHYISHH